MSSNPYFESATSLRSNTSTDVSPTASCMLSPSSCSTAVSNLSLAFDSRSQSPSTSACTSISDASSEKRDFGVEEAVPGEPSAAEDDEELIAAAAQERERDELDQALRFGAQIVQREARALNMAARRMARLGPQKDGFREAVRLVLKATNGERGGKVVMTGVGKSGIIARKLSATFLSLGTPSMFLHPVEALHGDLGLLTPHRDVVVALSHSGSSPELLTLIPHLNARKCPIIALVGKRESALVKAADAWIDCGTGKDDDSDDEDEDEDEDESTDDQVTDEKRKTRAAAKRSCSCSERSKPKRPETRQLTDEAWDEVPAPSSSTTVALAMGDALAFSVTRAKGLGRDMFAFNHPGGKLGADFRLQGHLVNGGDSAVATPVAA